MGSRSTSRKLTPARQQELQVAAAVAREAVIQLHADHALALIRHADDQVSGTRMLDIYLRLLGLVGTGADMVSNRVLSSLGHPRPSITRSREPAGPADATDAQTGERNDAAEPERRDESILQTLRRRLRGRVNDKLRRTVEIQTGAAHAALLDLHVRHAHGFVRLLDGSLSIADACGVYTDSVPVPQNFASVLYILVLDRIAADGLNSWPASAGLAGQPQQHPAPNGAAPGTPPDRHDLGRGGNRHRARRPA